VNDDTIRKAMRLMASKGGKASADRLTKAQRIARAKKAAAASAKVRSEKAKKWKESI
jgi:hypothetical protein